MSRINLLDEVTSNKIAAGEVVERPSSVVKELVENSIDAGAKNIIIEVLDGGESLIRIIDDGYGIHSEDVEKAFLPHATSKIKDVEDIYSIKTLGFRGEALPSIASVSKTLLKTKYTTDDFGTEIYLEAGELKYKREGAINKGTLIEVRDIFYNIPARKKFLKSTSREGALINDIVSRIALSNPDVSFKLYNNNKSILHTYGNGNLLDTIRCLYGKQISENVLYFEEHNDTISVYGYIGREEISRGSRNNQSIFVNNRYIKNKLITVASENAFKSFSTVNKYPFFTIFLEVYPEFVDVNIHPTKAEIKFNDERQIFKIVFDTIHKTLKKDIADSFYIPEENNNKNEEFKVEELMFSSVEFTTSSNAFSNSDSKSHNENTFAPIIEKEVVSIPIDLKTEIYEKYNSKIQDNENYNLVGETNKEVYNHINLNDTSTIAPDNRTTNGGERYTDPKFPSLKIIGQFNNTYVLGEYDAVLYLIDQHAAHEKILFEKYLKAIENKELVVQTLLIPVALELSLDDYSYFEENKEVFNSAGFLVEEFGTNSIRLVEVPYFLDKLNPKELFLAILDNLKSLGSGKTTDVKYNKIATMACRAAVKANDLLSHREMDSLIEELRFIDDPFNCPHGRPTIIKFTSYELDKKFRRIL